MELSAQKKDLHQQAVFLCSAAAAVAAVLCFAAAAADEKQENDPDAAASAEAAAIIAAAEEAAVAIAAAAAGEQKQDPDDAAAVVAIIVDTVHSVPSFLDLFGFSSQRAILYHTPEKKKGDGKREKKRTAEGCSLIYDAERTPKCNQSFCGGI